MANVNWPRQGRERSCYIWILRSLHQSHQPLHIVTGLALLITLPQTNLFLFFLYGLLPTATILSAKSVYLQRHGRLTRQWRNLWEGLLLQLLKLLHSETKCTWLIRDKDGAVFRPAKRFTTWAEVAPFGGERTLKSFS